MRLWETQTLSAEVEFKKLVDQSDYNNKVEPLYYWGKLGLAILAIFMSLNFYYLILIQFCTQIIEDFWGLQYNWLNDFAIYCNSTDGSMDLSFLINWVFITFCLYGVYAAVAGNDYYGYRSSCFTFYAMTVNETQFNSFLFNACLRNAVCVAVVMLAALNLPNYTANS